MNNFWDTLQAIIWPRPVDAAFGFPFVDPVIGVVTDFHPEDWTPVNDNQPA